MNVIIFQLFGHIYWKQFNRILEIISQGKGVIPYEIIVDMESFFIKPDEDFWENNRIF